MYNSDVIDENVFAPIFRVRVSVRLVIQM